MNDIKTIVVSFGLGALIIVLLVLFNTNELRSTPTLVCAGVYLEEKPYFIMTETGNKSGIKLYIQLDSGEMVGFKKVPGTKAVMPGDRVKVYYRKGFIFKNNIYDRYEPLNDSPRFWTESELMGIQK